MLPSIIQIGTTYYMYTANNDNADTTLSFWTSPASDGLTWSCGGPVFRTVNSTDWGFTAFNRIPATHVWKKSHCFFELVYPVGSIRTQKISYMSSPSWITWYKYTTVPV